jgi:hypothetical protein
MDKKNVQNEVAENLLTEKKIRLDKKILWSQTKRNIKKIMVIIFYIFFGKVFRNFSCYNL